MLATDWFFPHLFASMFGYDLWLKDVWFHIWRDSCVVRNVIYSFFDKSRRKMLFTMCAWSLRKTWIFPLVLLGKSGGKTQLEDTIQSEKRDSTLTNGFPCKYKSFICDCIKLWALLGLLWFIWEHGSRPQFCVLFISRHPKSYWTVKSYGQGYR